MTSPEYTDFDPTQMMLAQYWGDAAVHTARLTPNPARQVQRQVSSLMGPVVRSIISGKSPSYQIAEGVEFDPLNPELAGNTAFYEPGTVLLADVETLVTNEPLPDAITQACIFGNTDPDVLLGSPRAAVASQGYAVDDFEVLPFVPMRLQSGETEYTRFIDLVCLAPDKRGRLCSLGTEFVLISPYGTHADQFNPKVSPAFSFTKAVGETTVIERQGGGVMYSRLRSVEVCDTSIDLSKYGNRRKNFGRYALKRAPVFAPGL